MRFQQTFFIIAVFFFKSSFAQTSKPDTIYSHFTNSTIVLDGKLNEPAWAEASHISNFTQQELNNGQPATERTEIAVLFNENNMYIGIWCFDSEPNKIMAKNFSRDFNYGGDDAVEMIFDTYNDQRNAYKFVVNANGARYDSQLAGANENVDWNGVWDCKAQITKEGWFAELIIPFSTLQFRRDSTSTWGLNIERGIKHKHERIYWQGWSRDYNLETLSQAGKLTGFKNIKGMNRLEILPYLLTGAESANKSNRFLKKVGVDFVKQITPTLKANLTINTDFGQVEADRKRVNLTRFSMYYPEKRGFFLEGKDLYSSNLGDRIFYSRRIGIAGFQPIPIIAGARLFGKINQTNVGFLNVQTASQDSVATANYTVVRLNQDVLKQSNVGMIFTSKINGLSQNYIFGIDGTYRTSSFLGNKNLAVGYAFAQNNSNTTLNKQNTALNLIISYPNDYIETNLSFTQVKANFDPQTGFNDRKNFKKVNSEFKFMPRWLESWGVSKFVFKPYDFECFFTDNTNQLESYDNEVRVFGFNTKSGELFEFNLQQKYDRIDQPFRLIDGITISAGKYHWFPYEIQVRTFSGRKVSCFFNFNQGGFYTGRRTATNFQLNTAFLKRFNFTGRWDNNRLQFYGKEFWVNELAGTLDLAISTRLNFSLFTQWNSEDKEIASNFRIHWIPKIGSDLYFVFTQVNENDLRLSHSKLTNGMLKFVYRIAI